MESNRNARGAAGFTLLELLIVMGLFMVVMVPVLGVFSSSYQSYVVQDAITAAQQEVRAALMIMERDVRMAGSGIKELVTPQGRLYGLQFDNAFNGTNGSDKIIIFYKDPDLSPCNNVETNDTDGRDLSGNLYCDSLPELTMMTSRDGGGNSVNMDIVEELTGSDWVAGCNCNGTIYTDPYTSGNKPDFWGIVTSPDGKKSAAFMITNATNTGGGSVDMIQNAPTNNSDYRGRILNDYPAGSKISFFSWAQAPGVEYFLGNDNVLYRRTYQLDPNDITAIVGNSVQSLAENVEDLQFALIGDFDENGTIEMADACGAADGSTDCINSADLLSASANADDLIDRIAYVRISILVRTAREHQELSPSPRPDVEDNAGTWPADHYRRRLVQQDVMVRNMALTDITNP